MKMKIYIDDFGVLSITLEGAIKALEELVATGDYNFLNKGAKYIKAKPDEYGMFRQGSRVKFVDFNMVSLMDMTDDEDQLEMIKYHLEKLKEKRGIDEKEKSRKTEAR